MDFIQEYPDLIPEEVCKLILNNLEQDNTDNSKYLEWHDLYNITDNPDLNCTKEIKETLTLVNEKIKKYFEPVKQMIPYDFKYCGFSVLKTKPEGLTMHYDEAFIGKGSFEPRTFVALIYLTSLNDSEGGEIFFPHQGKMIKPQAGTLVIFPTFFTYPHCVLPTTGTRFVMRLEYKINTETIKKG